MLRKGLSKEKERVLQVKVISRVLALKTKVPSRRVP
jgi:hypothetical protein